MPDILLNEAQQRRLLASARHIDKLLGEIEQILRAAESKSPFPKYRPDVAPHQARLLASHITRFRSHLSRALTAAGIEHGRPAFGAYHAIRVTLAFVRIAVQEMAPEHLRGYGELSAAAAEYLRGLSSELQGLLATLDRALALGERADLAARIERLDSGLADTRLLAVLDRIVTEYDLAEFRMPLLQLVDKAETREYEVAVFGRVSSGKSTLLNRLLGVEVLPVGVNPITAVPVRLRYGPQPAIEVSLAGGQTVKGSLADLEQYVSEERNPGNQLGVTRVLVEIPSSRLAEGFVLVDTPGLGATATTGAAETLAYLPRSDLGIVLISAVTPIGEEDLEVIEALVQGGTTPLVVLSKADLLGAEDLERAVGYTIRQIQQRLGRRIEVCPVSTRPGYEALLDTWLRQELAGLEGRHRELVQESIGRKLSAVGHGVAAALRAALGGEREVDRARLADVERKLREAAAHLEEARQSLLEATDRVRLLERPAIQQAAARLVAGERPVSLARIASELAAAAAVAVADRLRQLARELESALRLAATVFENDETAPQGSLESVIREMPRWEAPLGEIDLRAPRIRFSAGIAEARVARRLRAAVGEQLAGVFNSYARRLERWVRRTLAELRNRFEQEADACRAQILRLERRQGPTQEPGGKIERALKELEEALQFAGR